MFPGPPPGAPGGALDQFRQGLREHGLVEGRDFTLDVQFDELQPAIAAGQVEQMVRNGVDLIVAGTTIHTILAQRATRSIPIVMAVSGDPVAQGLVASLGRPGGNTTGMSIMSPELAARRLQLLVELLPGLQRVGLLVDREVARWVQLPEHEAAANRLGLQLIHLNVSRPEDFTAAFEAARSGGAQCLLMVQSVMLAMQHKVLADLALAHRLPALAGSGDAQFARAGGLMNYGASIGASWQRSAVFVRRILEGARPGELPIEQPSRFEFAINLRTAEALRLKVPQSLLLLADTVIR